MVLLSMVHDTWIYHNNCGIRPSGIFSLWPYSFHVEVYAIDAPHKRLAAQFVLASMLAAHCKPCCNRSVPQPSLIYWYSMLSDLAKAWLKPFLSAHTLCAAPFAAAQSVLQLLYVLYEIVAMVSEYGCL
jgi:hypothetical protein